MKFRKEKNWVEYKILVCSLDFVSFWLKISVVFTGFNFGLIVYLDESLIERSLLISLFSRVRSLMPVLSSSNFSLIYSLLNVFFFVFTSWRVYEFQIFLCFPSISAILKVSPHCGLELTVGTPDSLRTIVHNSYYCLRMVRGPFSVQWRLALK